MTKEITKSIILQEIQDKFKMREFSDAKFLFDETVVPTYNIGQHLEDWWLDYETKSITAIGPTTFYTIPAGERWTLARYDVVFMTGVFTIAGIYITRKNYKTAGSLMYLDLAAAQNVSYHVELKTPVVLNPGDLIRVHADGYTSTGNLRLYIDYMLEEIR